ncbi:DUF2637 domain-containing protein [Actinacidiphila sp. DG2A-62]|uniref:DUF2637 domain-containing protein n=1 Tax=Actinacidiphila sp. DG2A-62 TaxID=3108821 RepID=UPI003FA35B6B
MFPNAHVPVPRATAWDRAAITVLGGAGCALSYDALQQMAVAIHVRPALTYLFPAVIDGFIAYGIRALLVLRTAPFRARLYVWTLFTTATAASIWANALHAIRLNQQTHAAGLHLSDTTVGILSTLAPLALAGAVHLHILITRHGLPAVQVPVRRPTETPPSSDSAPETEVPPARSAEAEAVPSSGQAPVEHARAEEHPAAIPDESVRRIGRPPSAGLDELLALARPVFVAHENPTRAVVRDHVHAAGHTIAEDRLTQIMTALRREQPGR